MKKTVGFLGLGEIGGGICSWLARSGRYDVLAFDPDPAAVDRVVREGASLAPSLEVLGGRADIIIASLPDPGSASELLAAPGGLIQWVRPPTAVFDLTTMDAQTSKDFAAQFAQRQVLYVDTPPVGSKFDADSGTLALLVGASEEELRDYMPFFRSMTSTVHFVGARGAGSTVKLVNNVMAMGNLLFAAEAMALGVKAGVDGGTLFNVIQYLGGSSQRLITRFPEVLKGEFPPRFSIDLAQQHLEIALEAARKLAHSTPMAQACHEVYREAIARGHGGGDVTGVVQHVEAAAGVQIRGEAHIASVKWGA